MGGAQVELIGTHDDTLHSVLRAAAEAGPTAMDALTGSVVVMRHADVEALAHDPRLAGVGLSLFDLMEVPEGPLRTWYGGLMFTNEGETHRRLRSLVSRAFTPRRSRPCGRKRPAPPTRRSARSPLMAGVT